ncbi:Actin-related protein 2/3 complex subunit 1 [Phytophthora cinnamomi]|uniref:Actin-related protein 2/3 complex subunit 1 n=1 Tax=Phytophthora cinnamomi TaxID=4785 RepID=UPI00355A6E54|nr:Actin-related protein 2/3 complex subunit 1 [Phytophthora cinnamomi]
MIVAVVPKKGSKSSRREWKLADEVVEDKKKRKQRVHREEMVQYRQRKKIQGSELRAEHRSLQRNIERHVAEWKNEAAKCTARTRLPLGADNNEVAILQNQVRELVLQAEALRVENATLQGAVAGYVQLQGVVYAESDRLAQVCAGSVLGGAGWRVNFANGEPSFHYYPFSETECDAIVQTYDGRMNGEELMGCGGFTQVGTLLGWSVERTPLAFHDNLKWMETRVKFTKRIQCVAGAAGATMSKLEAESWSVLTTPELYARVHRATLDVICGT